MVPHFFAMVTGKDRPMMNVFLGSHRFVYFLYNGCEEHTVNESGFGADYNLSGIKIEDSALHTYNTELLNGLPNFACTPHLLITNVCDSENDHGILSSSVL